MSVARKAKLTQPQIEAVARALADPRRMAIFQQIARSPGMPCSCLHEHNHISPATISHHMKELHDAGLVDIAREGRTASLTVRRDIWSAYLEHLATF